MTDRPTDPRWLPIADAAAELGVSKEALRSKVKRRSVRARKGNDGRVLVLVNDRPTWAESDPAGPETALGRSRADPGPCGPAGPLVSLETAQAMVAAALADRDRLHREHVERLERAWKANAAALVENVGRVLVAQRRRSWWSQWFGQSKRSDIG